MAKMNQRMFAVVLRKRLENARFNYLKLKNGGNICFVINVKEK